MQNNGNISSGRRPERETVTPSNVGNLRSQSISDEIMSRIIEAILNGELQPGDRLPTEAELAAEFGVGRNSVREAIKMLSSVGAVRVSRGEGTFVAKEPPENILNPLVLSLSFAQGTTRELIEMRMTLEAAAADLVAQAASAEDIEELQRANDRLLAAAESEDTDGHTLRDLDMAFHKTFYRLTRNRLLVKVSDAIYSLFRASIETTVETDPKLAYRNHQLLIDALRRGGGADDLRDAIRESLAMWADYLADPTS